MKVEQDPFASELKRLLQAMDDRDLKRISAEIKAEVAARVARARKDPEAAWAKAMHQ